MAELSPEVKSNSPPEGRSPRNGPNESPAVINNPIDCVNVGVTTGAPIMASNESTTVPTTPAPPAAISATTVTSVDIVATASNALPNIVASNVSTIAIKDKDNTKNNGNSSPRSPKQTRRMRIKMNEQQLETATRDELATKWREQDLYVECLEAQVATQEGDLACLRDSEEKYRQQCCEISHRERILVRRLASKEQQLLGYVNQLTEMRAIQTPSASALRSALLDPAVNILIKKLRQELLSTKAKLEDTQNELSAWKFTPDSNTGKRLMAKCRLLYQENEELGRMIASGRIAKLEGELALQKSFSEEVKKSQSELDEFLQDLDEDVEGMQSTIYFLQQELRKARESVSLLQQENIAFKSASISISTSSCLIQPSEIAETMSPLTPINDVNLSNGVSLSENLPIKKEDLTNVTKAEEEEEEEEDEKIEVKISKIEKLDDTIDENSPKPLTITSIPSSPTIIAIPEPEKLKDVIDNSPNRELNEEPDESSNDSAALIIKVENEELSDRDDEDEEEEKIIITSPSSSLPPITTTTTTTTTTMTTTTTTNTAVTDIISETRRPQRLSTRTKEKCIAKNESVVGKSNGDERNTARTSTRRLLRDRTTAKREKNCAPDSDDERRQHKKKRREIVLSMEYSETEDDALLITNGETIQSENDD